MLAKQYFLIATKIKKPVEALSIEMPDQKNKIKIDKNWGEPVKQLITIPLGEDPEKTVQIRSQLKPDLREKLIFFLQTNADVFVWSASDMLRISIDVIVHK